jgi:hypothetical protein
MSRRRYLTVSVALVLIAASAVFVWRWQHRGPSAPSVSDAIGRFRTSSTFGTGSTQQRFVPPEGVYLYDGTGRESLSFLSTKQNQGPIEPGTVVHRSDGCWEFRLDYNSFHSQTWMRCATRKQLRESGGTTTQKFDFATFKMAEHSTVTCDAAFVVLNPDAKPGTKSPMRCEGRSQTTKSTLVQQGVATYVGPDPVTVGGVAVLAGHTRERMRLSGDQTGNVDIDIWFDVVTGLPLKEAHHIRVVSPAPPPLDHVTYAEDGVWQLRSTTPRT